MYYLLAKSEGAWKVEASDKVKEILAMEVASLLEDRMYKRNELKIIHTDNIKLSLACINHQNFYAY